MCKQGGGVENQLYGTYRPQCVLRTKEDRRVGVETISGLRDISKLGRGALAFDI